MAEPIRIVIADDHQMFIDGIRALLKKETRFQFMHEAHDAEGVLAFLKDHEVDLLITDLSMPGMGGMELTRIIKRDYAHIKVLVLTMYNDPAIINQILQVEAEGYILKNTGKQELITAIDRILDHGTFYSSEVMRLMKQYNRRNAERPPQKEQLTPRELEILKLVCEDLTTAAIADKLFISPRTVDTHRKNILEKTKCKTIVGLIRYAFDHHIVDPAY